MNPFRYAVSPAFLARIKTAAEQSTIEPTASFLPEIEFIVSRYLPEGVDVVPLTHEAILHLAAFKAAFSPSAVDNATVDHDVVADASVEVD